MTTTDKASSRDQSQAAEGGAASRIDLGPAKYDLGRKLNAIVSVAKTWEDAAERAAALFAAAPRAEVSVEVARKCDLQSDARAPNPELPGDTLALACRIWGEHWAPNEIPGLTAFGDAYAAAVAPPHVVASDRSQGQVWKDNMGPAAFTADRLIALAAFGYALGRMTYMPSHVASWLLAHKHLLSDHDRRRIVGDIDWAAERTQLGMDCDVETWLRLRDALAPTADGAGA